MKKEYYRTHIKIKKRYPYIIKSCMISSSIKIISVFILFLFLNLQNEIVDADSDLDLSGLYRDYNTDDSKEATVTFDWSDDEVWKVFFIGPTEYNYAHYVHLWLYARAWGPYYTNNLGYSHRVVVYNSDYPSGQTAYTFYAGNIFDTDNFHWQRFQILKTYFKSSSWNRVEIYDVDPTTVGPYHGWEVNNLQIGIDKTFPLGAGSIEDLDKSYWYSGSYPRPTPETRNCEGELMMALEFIDKTKDTQYFPSLQSNWDYHWYNGWYEWVYLDDSNDDCYWKTSITQTDIDHCFYARLFIYGYAWTSNPGQETYLTVQINGHTLRYYPNKDFGQCHPKGAWSWIWVPVGFLQTGTNEFYFSDSTSYTHTNIAIVIFNNIDNDHSKWHYNDGHGWHGYSDYELDEGELGIYLLMYDDVLGRSWDRTAYTIEISNPSPPTTQPYNPQQSWIDPGMEITGDRLQQINGWTRYELVQHDYSQQNVHQGDIYSELYNDQGDMCDFILLEGHGNNETYWLPEYDLNDPQYHKYDDKNLFDVIDNQNYHEGYTEAEYWPCSRSSSFDGALYGEDGYTFNTDWIVLFSCSILGTSNEQPDTTNAFQTLLYHGMHIVMGFYGHFSVSPDTFDTVAWNFHDFLTSPNQMTIIEAFKAASNSLINGQPWAYFAHENCVNDYLWDQGSVATPPDMWIYAKFEHKDDIVYSYKP